MNNSNVPFLSKDIPFFIYGAPDGSKIYCVHCIGYVKYYPIYAYALDDPKVLKTGLTRLTIVTKYRYTCKDCSKKTLFDEIRLIDKETSIEYVSNFKLPSFYQYINSIQYA